MNEIISENVGLVSLLTFFLGLGLGNRLAIGRDRRKEFNEAAKPIRAWLLSEVNTPSPYSEPPSDSDIDHFAHCLPMWKKGCFVRKWENLKKLRSNSKSDLYGQITYGNQDGIREIVKSCLAFTNRR
jgi:hypothetical protein